MDVDIERMPLKSEMPDNIQCSFNKHIIVVVCLAIYRMKEKFYFVGKEISLVNNVKNISQVNLFSTHDAPPSKQKCQGQPRPLACPPMITGTSALCFV